MRPLRRRGSGSASSKPRRPAVGTEPDTAMILVALADPVIVIDRSGRIRFVNPAAEQFIGASAGALYDSELADCLAVHSPLLSLVDLVWKVGNTISEYDMMLEGPRFGSRSVTIQAALAAEA